MPKLLLVEDNEVSREILALRLQRRGYQIISAVNGAEGVSKALGNQPDLVLMSLHLPVMDAWEAIRQIKVNPHSQSIPVIALAVDAIEGDRAQVVAGCDEYATKPIDLPRLLDKIDRLLEKTKAPCQEFPSVSQQQMQRVLLNYLRHELCTPINAIIGYSDLLLNERKAQQNSSLLTDIQKIYSCGAQLLTLVTSILNPMQLEVNQHHWDPRQLASTIRLELLTPLSTVIGYCEMLLEEAPADAIPDLDRIHRAAQQLLSMINDIINLAKQQLQLVETKGRSVQELMLESYTATALAQNIATTIQSLSQDAFAPVAQGGTILVVDDNETNCELLSRQLEGQGHIVATAMNGQQALRMLKAMPYDLMLVDVVMAGMSGFELLQQLKEHQEWRHIPVLMISALDECDSAVKCIELGAEDYLCKPFNPTLLQARIGACLEKKRLRDQEIQLQQQIAERTLELEREIIERKRAEVAACEANQAKSTFLANMSHELRTPLNVILGFTQLMTRNGSLTPQQQGYLDTISYSGEHLLNLINDVLDISKIEAGGAVLNENNFNLCGFLDSLQQMLRLKAESKGLQLVFDLVPDLPQYICTDENKLCQVLMNLLGNAIKFTQAGSVTLRVRYGQKQTTPSLIKFVVEDTGPGIAATELESMFEPFVQTLSGRNSQEGSGLGLSISRKFVSLMGGDITVDSELGEGTVFKFDIQTSPVENELQDQESSRQIVGLEAGPKYRILVAEDKPENRQLLVELLTSVGFEVREAANGQEAIALGKSWSPHLIWMDMRMPVLDGFEATKQIKATGTQAPVVIALSGSALEKDRLFALSMGCDDFMRKPFRVKDIFEKMTQYLGVRYLYGSPQSSSKGTGNLSILPQQLLQPNELKEALSVMSVDWVEQLHQAATQVNARKIHKLLTQIPGANSHLTNALTHLVNNFCFEEIVTLTQQ